MSYTLCTAGGQTCLDPVVQAVLDIVEGDGGLTDIFLFLFLCSEKAT
jgi:hypothetical protein